jgi:pyrroline-5-carboxylate reductase
LNWGFIGCGNLAQAIVTGGLSTGVLKASRVYVTNRSQDKLRAFAKRQKIKALADNLDLVQRSQIVVIGTKPQDIGNVFQEIAPHLTKKHVVVSLAAGVPMTMLKKHLPGAGALVRVMANTPATIQRGVYGIYQGSGTKSQTRSTFKLFSEIGTAVEVKSDEGIDGILATAASGSGFVFLFMEIFETWLVKRGFAKDLARRIAVESFAGTSELARQRATESLQTLRGAVTSKKGTTLAGLKAMSKGGIKSTIEKGLGAAVRRGLEISRTLEKNS